MPPRVDISKPLRPPLNEVPIHIPPREVHSKKVRLFPVHWDPLLEQTYPTNLPPYFTKNDLYIKQVFDDFVEIAVATNQGTSTDFRHQTIYTVPNKTHCSNTKDFLNFQ